MNKKYFIGIAVRRDVINASIKEGAFFDRWLSRGDKYYDLYYDLIKNYKGVKKGDIGFLYSANERKLYGVFEAISKPKRLTTPRKFGPFYATLQIDVKLKTDSLKEIPNAHLLLNELGFNFKFTAAPWPYPRVFDEDKGKVILKKF